MILVKVPAINCLGKNKGARNAGNEIIFELGKIKGDLEIEELHVDNNNLDEQERLIYENSKNFFKNQNKVIFLGGDHSLTYSTGKAFLEYFRKAFFIIFDAHPDLMEPMENPTHEEWLRALIEQDLKAESILLIGVRNIDKQEQRFLEKNKIKMVKIEEIRENINDVWREIESLVKDKELYLSIDIDVLDPEQAPSTGYKETEGLSDKEIIYFASELSKLRNLKAIDIVEVNSEEDLKKDKITIKLANKILSYFLK